MRKNYVPGSLAAGWTHDFRKQCAPDGEYQCRLWLSGAELIHEYQTDSSSKPPAPESVLK